MSKIVPLRSICMLRMGQKCKTLTSFMVSVMLLINLDIFHHRASRYIKSVILRMIDLNRIIFIFSTHILSISVLFSLQSPGIPNIMFQGFSKKGILIQLVTVKKSSKHDYSKHCCKPHHATI